MMWSRYFEALLVWDGLDESVRWWCYYSYSHTIIFFIMGISQALLLSFPSHSSLQYLILFLSHQFAWHTSEEKEFKFYLLFSAVWLLKFCSYFCTEICLSSSWSLSGFSWSCLTIRNCGLQRRWTERMLSPLSHSGGPSPPQEEGCWALACMWRRTPLYPSGQPLQRKFLKAFVQQPWKARCLFYFRYASPWVSS